jgi:hypothetical protein
VEQAGPEADARPNHADHGWPTVAWEDANELVDKWRKMELEAFDPGDPSMNQGGELTDAEAKRWWSDQVEEASMTLENELAEQLRQTALRTMQDVTDRLIDGEFA